MFTIISTGVKIFYLTCIKDWLLVVLALLLTPFDLAGEVSLLLCPLGDDGSPSDSGLRGLTWSSSREDVPTRRLGEPCLDLKEENNLNHWHLNPSQFKHIEWLLRN